MYHLYIGLDDEPIRGSPFSINVITLRPDAAQCVVRGEALRKAVARMPQRFDVLFVDAIGHTAHAEELDVYVEPWPEGEPSPVASPIKESDEGTTSPKFASEESSGEFDGTEDAARDAPAIDTPMRVEPPSAPERDGRQPEVSGGILKSPSARASPRMKKLDAPTRQRHLQLWQTRQAADKWLVRRAAEKSFHDTGYGDEGKKKKKINSQDNLPR